MQLMQLLRIICTNRTAVCRSRVTNQISLKTRVATEMIATARIPADHGTFKLIRQMAPREAHGSLGPHDIATSSAVFAQGSPM